MTRLQFERLAVDATLEHVLAKGALHDLGVGGDTLPALAVEPAAVLNRRVQRLGRRLQAVGMLVTQVGERLADFVEAVLGLLLAKFLGHRSRAPPRTVSPAPA